jgi:hypothetical protein
MSLSDSLVSVSFLHVLSYFVLVSWTWRKLTDTSESERDITLTLSYFVLVSWTWRKLTDTSESERDITLTLSYFVLVSWTYVRVMSLSDSHVSVSFLHVQETSTK